MKMLSVIYLGTLIFLNKAESFIRYDSTFVLCKSPVDQEVP